MAKGTVLMLPMSLDIGGAETHVVCLAKSLKKRGWSVLVSSSGGRRVSDLEAAGIEHIEAPLDSRSPVKMAEAFKKISRILDTYPVSLIHAHARIPAFIADRLTGKRAIPLVTTYHGTFKSGPFWNLFTRSGDHTFAVSDDIEEYIALKFGFDRRKISVIPNGIDTDSFVPGIKNDDEVPTVLYMSRLDGELGNVAVAAIRAVFSLDRAFPGIKIFIGGDGEAFDEVQAESQRINTLAKRELSTCLGFVADTPQIFQKAHLVIGMSRVALEAMACKKPVIIAGPDGNRGILTEDLVSDMERTNYTSRGASRTFCPEELAKSVNLLLGDPILRRELGEMGREIVLKHHSMAMVAKKTEDLYLSLLPEDS